MQVGIKEVSGQDVTQDEFAEYEWEYDSYGRVISIICPAPSPEEDTHNTVLIYCENGTLSIIRGSADVHNGTRPETEFTWDGYNRLVMITDPVGRETTFTYDGLGRRVQVTHDDASTEQVRFGDGGTSFQADMIVGRKDRMGVVHTSTFDSSGRTTESVRAGALDSDIRDGQSYTTTVSDPNMKDVTTFEYVSGTSTPESTTTNNRKRTSTFDYKRRVVSSTVYPSDGVSLTK